MTSKKENMITYDAEFYETAAGMSEALVMIFNEQKKYFKSKQSLEGCYANERLKLDELHNIYKKNLETVKFLNLAYFENYSSFVRYQELPEKCFITDCSNYLFVSHRWETPINPDPQKRQFNTIKNYVKTYASGKKNYGVWYDFSCIPQRNKQGKRSAKEKAEFEKTLSVMHLLPLFSDTIILFYSDYMSRAWCFMEWMFTHRAAVATFENGIIFPFGNKIKFHQVALVIMYMTIDHESKTMFLKGNDDIALGFLTSLLNKAFTPTRATYASDKSFLIQTAHRHFFYNIRYLGLRSQLALGFQIVNQLDDANKKALFNHFIFASSDPMLNWTKEFYIDRETMILKTDHLYHDLVFHRKEIEVSSKSKMTTISRTKSKK